MPIDFKLNERIIGFSATSAGPGEKVAILPSDLIPPADAFRLSQALEHLQSVLLGFIPGLPPPSMTDHLLVVIRPDLSGVAYANELKLIAKVRVNRAVEAGTPVFPNDIADVSELHPGVEVPDDCAVVMIQSSGWKRSLYFDFGPLDQPPRHRSGQLDQVLARQTILLLGIAALGDTASDGSARKSPADHMAGAAPCIA